MEELYYYEKLKENLGSVVYYLRKSINELDGIDSNLTSYYSIDESKIESVNINSTYKMLTDRLNYLNNTVIPLIDSKINSLK